MVDLTLKNIPAGSEDRIKRIAAAEVERFLNQRDLSISDAVKTKFQSDVDTFLTDNGLEKKFDRQEIDIEL